LVFDFIQMFKSTKKIVYLIPMYSKTGGVEVAANTLIEKEYQGFQLEKLFVCLDIKDINNPLKIIGSVRRILASKPDIIIMSLWRSSLVGLLSKIFRPRIKLILFIHSEKNTNFFDYIFTRIAYIFSIEIWSDSNSSFERRFRFKFRRIPRIISFNSRIINRSKELQNMPNFIYWGRKSIDKGLIRALKIFNGVKKYYPNAKFRIIGPDCEDTDIIKSFINKNGLNSSVLFYDALDFQDIYHIAEKSSYYIQASKFEGMAISVVEAMKIGLVPIVTPAGEITNYCNEKNSIIVHSNIETVRDILLTLQNEDTYTKLSLNASRNWARTTYKESFIEACRNIISYEHD